MSIDIHKDQFDAGSFWIDLRTVNYDDTYPATISSAGVRKLPKAYEEPHSNRDIGEGGAVAYHILQYTLSGKGHITYGTSKGAQHHELTAGQCFFITRDEKFQFSKQPEDEWECLYIGLRGELAAHVFRWIFQYGFVHTLLENSSSVASFRHLLNRGLHGQLSQWEIKQIACRILLDLQKDIAITFKNEEDTFCRDAQDWIQENISKCSVKLLAERYGYSEKYFQQIFKQRTSMTPGMFIQKQRLAYAKHLASCTDMKLATIAKLAGFSDASHLCRLFRQMYGMTIQDFRTNSQSGRTAVFSPN